MINGTIALPAFAQGVDVRGVVVDSTTGERLPFVNIGVAGTNKGAASNVNGFFLIANIPYGRYEIAASAVGYERQVKSFESQGEEPVTVNFRLSPKPIEVSEVLIETQRTSEPVGTASVHVLGTQDIQQIPLPLQHDLLRAIQIIPGIVSTADVNSKFYVRGGAGDQNLILLDGMKIYNPFHAFGVFGVFDPDIISTTEIFTGAFPAGYGNRLSSVLNMMTKQGNTSRLSGKGDVNFLAAKLQLEGPLSENNSWIISGRTSLSDRALRHFVRNPAPVSFYDLFFKGTVGSPTGRYSLRGFLSGDNIASDKPDEPDYSWRNQAFALSLAGLSTDRIYADVLVYTNSFEIKRDSKASTVVPPAESNLREDGMRAQFTFYTERRELIHAGLELNIPEIENKFTNTYGIQRTFSSADADLWSWLRYQTAFGSLFVDVGIHSDIVSLFDEGPTPRGLQPRLSMRYQVADNWQVKGSCGFFNQRIITISNEDDITSLFEAWMPIPRNLRPEEAQHYVLGVEGILDPALSLNVQSYYKNYSSLVLYNREKFYSTDPDYVNGTGSSYGVETLVRYGSRLLDLYAAYTLGWVSVTTGGFTYSPRYDRRHTMNVMGVLHPIEHVELALRWEFGSGYPFTQTVGTYDRLTFSSMAAEPDVGETGVPYTILGQKNAARLPAYSRLDATITYRFSVAPIHGAAGIHVANLTDRKNILFYDRKTGQHITMLDFFPSASLELEF